MVAGHGTVTLLWLHVREPLHRGKCHYCLTASFLRLYTGWCEIVNQKYVVFCQNLSKIFIFFPVQEQYFFRCKTTVDLKEKHNYLLHFAVLEIYLSHFDVLTFNSPRCELRPDKYLLVNNFDSPVYKEHVVL